MCVRGPPYGTVVLQSGSHEREADRAKSKQLSFVASLLTLRFLHKKPSISYSLSLRPGRCAGAQRGGLQGIWLSSLLPKHHVVKRIAGEK